MSQNCCPECGEQIRPASINIAEGVALCLSCGQLSRLSDVASDSRPAAEVLNNPPSGCSLVESNHGIVVTASLRSISQAFGLGCMALFWNGIVSVFALIALSGLYTNLIGPLPVWFPAPNDPGMTLGMTLFLCIFLIPFVAVGSGMLAGLLMCVIGKVKVQIGDEEAKVSTGIGPLVWTRRFDPTNVRRVTGGRTSWEINDQKRELIEIEADNRVQFGSMLESDRREWMQIIVRELLTKPSPQQRMVTIQRALNGLASR